MHLRNRVISGRLDGARYEPRVDRAEQTDIGVVRGIWQLVRLHRLLGLLVLVASAAAAFEGGAIALFPVALQGAETSQPAEYDLEQMAGKAKEYLKRGIITRRQGIKAGGIAAVELASSKPLLETIRWEPIACYTPIGLRPHGLRYQRLIDWRFDHVLHYAETPECYRTYPSNVGPSIRHILRWDRR